MRCRWVLQTLLLGVSTACATANPPTEQFIASESAIRSASDTGADQVPSAALHLQLAREQSAEARRLMDNGSYKQANALLLRAQADADLALALAREAPLRNSALEAMDALQAIKKQAEP